MFQELLLIEVTSFTIGTEGPKGEMVSIIRHNVSIPIKRMEVFSTSEDNQFQVSIPIFESESAKARDNKIFGTLEVAGIPPAPREDPQFKFDFDIEIDLNGILDVFEGFKTEDSTLSLTINNGELSRKEIEHMIKEAKAHRDEDRINSFRNGLDSDITDLSEVFKDAKVNKSSVDGTVLVGGSSQIFKVQQMLSEYFGGKALNRFSGNPDEAVVYGAAVKATVLSGTTLDRIKYFQVLDNGDPIAAEE
ncbi:70-kilodalton heat shock protein [Haplosporangium gracile]|nr:70-kilodalton heat shock protein [Haplosporangium gracile]